MYTLCKKWILIMWINIHKDKWFRRKYAYICIYTYVHCIYVHCKICIYTLNMQNCKDIVQNIAAMQDHFQVFRQIQNILQMILDSCYTEIGIWSFFSDIQQLLLWLWNIWNQVEVFENWNSALMLKMVSLGK